MADIIRLFASNETTFDHYETVLTDLISFVSSEEENGIFSFEANSPLDDRIEEGKIIKAPTARGEQLFRIIRVKKVIPGNYLYIYGRHITYDLLNNFILNIRPTDTTQANALSAILGGTETAHTFTSTSDVPGINTANYVRMNPIQAIMGNQSNSALNLWGGYLRRDNFEFKVLATSPDKGYEIRFGKNLIGIEEELDMTEVVTRFYPTVVIEEPTVTALPEKYVDSPLINNYQTPIIKEYRIDLTDDEKLLPIADIYQLMRDRCNAQFTLKADVPKTNYKVDFVQLRKTEQYKHLAILEELDISDTVYIYVPILNTNLTARMIKYTHDGLNDRFLSMELGNFKAKLTNQKAEFTKLVETATKELTDGVITTMLKNAVDRIQGNFGGNVVTITVDWKPVAMAFMDTDDVNTANEYIIINNKGIAFGVNGLNNPPELAIDIDGSIVGDSAFFRSLTTNLIQSELGNDLVLSSNTSIRFVSNNSATLDEDGFTIEDTVGPNKTTLKPDGMEVKNKSTDMDLLVVTPDGTYIPTLTADSIQSDSIVRAVGNLSYKTITYYLAPVATGDGSGRDEYNKADNITTALRNATNGGLVLKNVDVIIDIAPGKYSGLWRIMGYMGYGSLQLLFNPGTYLNGHIDIYDCACEVRLTAGATGNFTLTKGDLVNGITLLNSRNVFIERPVIIHPSATGYPVYLKNSSLVISSYDIAGNAATNPVRAIYADFNSQVYAMFGKGNTQNGAFSANRGSSITAHSGIPMPLATANPDCDTTTGTYFDKATSRIVSSAVVPPIVWQQVSKTFTADLYRINQSSMWRTNGEMAQGKSPNTTDSYKGYATWGNAISEYLASSGGYQNITSIVLTATRGGWGYGDDAMKITSPATKTMSLQARYTTATTELLGSVLQAHIETSPDLTLSTSTLLTDDYANFTKVTLKIVCDKKV